MTPAKFPVINNCRKIDIFIYKEHTMSKQLSLFDLKEDLIEEDVIQSLDPEERTWEYDGDGTKILKVSQGKSVKTPYNFDSGSDCDDYYVPPAVA